MNEKYCLSGVLQFLKKGQTKRTIKNIKEMSHLFAGYIKQLTNIRLHFF